MSSQLTGSGSEETTAGEYGANEWLVDEMYQKYLADPDSVDKTWWPVLEHYRQAQTPDANAPATPEPAAAPATPAPEAPAAAASAAPATAAPAAEAAAAPAPEAPAAAASAAPEAAAPAAPITSSVPVIGQTPEARTTSVAPRTAPVPADVPVTSPQPVIADGVHEDEIVTLKGLPKTLAANMDQSLTVPTATSVRTIPAKLMIDNRIVINNHLRRSRGGKISFTHLIGWAIIQALKDFPTQNVYYTEVDGKPSMVKPAHIGLGIAIDIPKPDGTRALLVPAIKRAETMTFNEYLTAYEDLVQRARQNKLKADDFSGATISLTNPGGIGTVHSVPRLMKGQGCIIGAGALEYPAEFQGSSEKTLANLAIGKTITLTSTYDHRVIQGAGSGEFLKKVHELLIGQRNFYEDLFAALRLPYEPIRWAPDISVDIASAIDKTARVQELINSFRVRGHLMADTDPLEYVQRSHPDLDIASHGLTFWDLDREFVTGGFGNTRKMQLRDILGVLRDSYCRTIGIEYMHIQDPVQRKWIQNEVERKYEKPT
ncbi:MAG TPA: 2-oxo acid dehydrogenase subunit E2, partial [Agromyces sp.]|nr:2-oxo acid dehydrogenase subunit E2 [Agromyces sp.]